jgi:hypothetical protein
MVTSDINAARHVLHEIATQSYNLAMGLQNAAPLKDSEPPKTVQYLLGTSLQIEKIGKMVEQLLLIEASQKKL